MSVDPISRPGWMLPGMEKIPYLEENSWKDWLIDKLAGSDPIPVPLKKGEVGPTPEERASLRRAIYRGVAIVGLVAATAFLTYKCFFSSQDSPQFNPNHSSHSKSGHTGGSNPPNSNPTFGSSSQGASYTTTKTPPAAGHAGRGHTAHATPKSPPSSHGTSSTTAAALESANAANGGAIRCRIVRPYRAVNIPSNIRSLIKIGKNGSLMTGIRTSNLWRPNSPLSQAACLLRSDEDYA